MSEQGTELPPVEEEHSEYSSIDRRRAMHGFDWGAAAALGVALVYGLLWGVVLLQWGLIAVGIMGGWVIGRAVRNGAWRGVQHPRTLRLQALSAMLAALSWFGAAWVAYFGSRLILESERSLVERLSDLTFGQYISQQYEAGGLFHAIALAAMIIMGWRTAR